jgi:hypothetical protein
LLAEVVVFMTEVVVVELEVIEKQKQVVMVHILPHL